MKKFLALALVLLLVFCSTGAALAAEAISITVTPLDYHTGRAVSKPMYAPDQVFRLKVGVSIPRFWDKSKLTIKWLVNGIDLKEPTRDADGYYYLEGLVLDVPASLTVRVEDTAYDTAQTAEELYNAINNDRTTDYTYYFSGSAAPGYEITIPKTGDMSIIGPVAGIAACLASLLLIPRRRR